MLERASGLAVSGEWYLYFVGNWYRYVGRDALGALFVSYTAALFDTCTGAPRASRYGVHVVGATLRGRPVTSSKAIQGDHIGSLPIKHSISNKQY